MNFQSPEKTELEKIILMSTMNIPVFSTPLTICEENSIFTAPNLQISKALNWEKDIPCSRKSRFLNANFIYNINLLSTDLFSRGTCFRTSSDVQLILNIMVKMSSQFSVNHSFESKQQFCSC